jgi:hypothetical protein
VTFGDLLTLLLGFFITVIALTREENIRASNRLAPSAAPITAQAASGIPLAEETREGLGHAPSSRPLLVLTDEHVADPRSAVLGMWLSEWIERGATKFEFSMCQEGAEELKVGEKIAAFLEVALPPQIEVRFSDVGISCSELRERALGVENAALARVVVQVSLVSNHG